MRRSARFLPHHPSGSPFQITLLALVILLASIASMAPAAYASDGPDPVSAEEVETPADTPADPSSDFAALSEEAILSSGRLPVLLRMPSVGVEMAVEAVGAKSDGGMETPSDPDDAAWFRYGTWPGDPGNAAIAGHVDWDGRARPFWYLRRLQEGDPIEIVSADGQSFEFQVQWARLYDAYDAPLDEIYGSTDTPEITLITCGGTFDWSTRQYLGRLVVRAAMQTSSS